MDDDSRDAAGNGGPRGRRLGAASTPAAYPHTPRLSPSLRPANHGEICAALLRPYILPKNAWLLANHEVFQAKFFLDKCGGDKDLADKVYLHEGIGPGHEFYEACFTFCAEYDQPSFDETYDTDSLDSFVPLVEEVFSRKPYWWEPADKPVDELDCKARLAAGYSLKVRSE